MAYKMEVIWSAKARITYFKVLDYLAQNWAKREILTFNVDLTGGYLDIRQFIEALIASRRMMLVDQVNFSLNSNRYQTDLSAIIKIGLPYYQSEK